MEFIENIKAKVGLIYLKYKLKSLVRSRETFNLDNSKNIGIVFDATDQKVYEIARSFIKFVMAGNVKVQSVGFINSTEVLDFYSYQTGVNFFSKKDLNWFYKPKERSITEFIDKEFDILIDLTIKNDYSLKYIANLSKAKFKIGRFVKDENHLDFMIDISQNNSTIFLVEQINHYLSLINKTK